MKPKNTGQESSTSLDWEKVRRVLLIRLRSIGDTVLMTPCLTALKSWRPNLHLAVLSERLSAPLLEDHPNVDDLIIVEREMNQWGDALERVRLVRRLRDNQYDVVFNLHGGPTATLLSYFSRAPERVGYRGYRYSWLLTRRAPTPQLIWQNEKVHSAEQQLGLLKWCGVPIPSPPPSFLRASEQALLSARRRLFHAGIRGPFALLHPAATSESKRWSVPKFAQVVKYVAARYDLPSVIIVARHEVHIADAVKGFAGSAAQAFADLSLKEVIAVSSLATIFIGNDSGPAHIAAAVGCPVVVIFGSSDPHIWGPWGDVPHAVVQAEFDDAGVRLSPEERIKHVRVEQVIEVIDRILSDGGEEPDMRISAVDRAKTPV